MLNYCKTLGFVHVFMHVYMCVHVLVCVCSMYVIHGIFPERFFFTLFIQQNRTQHVLANIIAMNKICK